MDGVKHTYYYAGGKLLRETYGSNTLDFFYDSNGTPYALKYNGTLYYYITNLQGDVMRIVDGSGTNVAKYRYDPYGNLVSSSGTMAANNPLRYRGYYFDSETGFYYLQSRYYDPKISRFINADDFASTGQGILGHNMFAYCGNNPVMGYDPCGACFHRWDFWNDCDACGGKTLEEKVYDTITTNILTAIDQAGPNSESTKNFINATMSFLQSNSFKSLYGVYQFGSGLIDFSDGIVLIAGPFPSPLDDFIGLYKMGQGGNLNV